MDTIQKTNWGSVKWMTSSEQGELTQVQGMHIGIVTMNPGAHQSKHIHYDEQVIYVLQGQCISVEDGVKRSMSAGEFIHMKAGIVHEAFNIGNVPFQHLLISNPNNNVEEEIIRKIKKPVSPDVIYNAVEAIRTQFLSSLHYGYAIFDSLGNLIVQSQFYPDFCVRHCMPVNNPGACSCMRQNGFTTWVECKAFSCKYGIEVFHYPIYFNDVFLGYIQSGYVKYSGKIAQKYAGEDDAYETSFADDAHDSNMENSLPEKQEEVAREAQEKVEQDDVAREQEDLYEVPESVVYGIRSLTSRIIKAIQNYCEFELFRQELSERELKIASNEETQRILLKNLKDTQYAVTDLKINNHFLFNTLNSMASMALDGGQMNLYQSIVDLSKMFHYTLRTQSSIVPLEKEVDYVKAYLQLQKLRYGDDLRIDIKVPKSVLQYQVPFNFLQPILENAFVHGFKEFPVKKLKLFIQQKQGMLVVKVTNNGVKLDEQACGIINQSINNNTSHGLSMIYQKLLMSCGDGCDFYVEADSKGNTCFTVKVPAVKA